ncbi:MAG: DNRLRE domain-containing protein [Archangiaceae bacterium]|nr:DNRLRE domain-containing protein [Archangiaceae bacterium]
MRARLGAAVLWLVVMGCPYGREMQPTGTGGGSAAGGAAAGGSVAGGAQAGGGSSSAGGAGGGSPELPDASVERDGGLDAGGPVGDSGVRDGGARPDAGLYRYVLTATEDTYVRSDLPSNNTGTVPYLVVDADPPPAVINKEALLRFQVGGGNIVRAELRLFSSNGSNSGLRVYHLTNTAWNELGTTWNNGPGLGTALLANLPVVPTDAGFTVDVTSVTRPTSRLRWGWRAAQETAWCSTAAKRPPNGPC